MGKNFMAEIQAKLNFLRMAPRKLRLVADLIRNKEAVKAREILSLLNKKAAKPLLKLLNSAVANAKHGHDLAVGDLRIAKLTVDGGPVLKRWMPRARGRATMIRERISHVNLTLVSRPEIKAKEEAGKGEEEVKIKRN